MVDQKILEELNDVWDSVIEQRFDHIIECAGSKGQGLAIFKMLDEEICTSRSNCKYIYIERGNHIMEHILSQFSEHDRAIIVGRGFERDDAIPISVQIPDGDGSTVGNLRIYSLSTRKEIEYYYTTAPEDTVDSQHRGLRRRVSKE